MLNLLIVPHYHWHTYINHSLLLTSRVSWLRGTAHPLRRCTEARGTWRLLAQSQPNAAMHTICITSGRLSACVSAQTSVESNYMVSHACTRSNQIYFFSVLSQVFLMPTSNQKHRRHILEICLFKDCLVITLPILLCSGLCVSVVCVLNCFGVGGWESEWSVCVVWVVLVIIQKLLVNKLKRVVCPEAYFEGNPARFSIVCDGRRPTVFALNPPPVRSREVPVVWVHY